MSLNPGFVSFCMLESIYFKAKWLKITLYEILSKDCLHYALIQKTLMFFNNNKIRILWDFFICQILQLLFKDSIIN